MQQQQNVSSPEHIANVWLDRFGNQIQAGCILINNFNSVLPTPVRLNEQGQLCFCTQDSRTGIVLSPITAQHRVNEFWEVAGGKVTKPSSDILKSLDLAIEKVTQLIPEQTEIPIFISENNIESIVRIACSQITSLLEMHSSITVVNFLDFNGDSVSGYIEMTLENTLKALTELR